ncbi:MAG: helix-turn-helix domain-containing protein [Lachnospiraceae bacterium]|nr:helix-turn-helix domain-containing protein [Lachnospiraceae bacterium]
MEIEYKKTGRPSKMPDAQTLVMLYEHSTATQLAEMFHVSPGTVRSWICRLRKEGSEQNGLQQTN